jgi:ornithine cyclodeaminase
MVHYFDEARVQQLLNVPDLLQGVREALVALTLGQVVQPLRMVMPIGEASADGLLFLKPAQLGDALSTKLITLVPGNAQKGLPTLLSTIVLMDPATGQTLAVMEGNTITAMRTAAASAVAADALVPRTPQVVAMLGSGVLARSHAQMLRAVREVPEIRVWSPTAANAQQCAHGIGGVACASAERPYAGPTLCAP